MSLYARNNFGYLQQAEAFFLSHSHVGLMIGSKDSEMLRHWRDLGIPIEVVCSGIHEAFEHFRDPPRRVAQCRKMVEKEFEAWRERNAGSHNLDDGAEEDNPLGRDLPDPTDPNRRRERALRRQRFIEARQPAQRDERLIPEDEVFLTVWYRSMWRLMDLGRDSETDRGREAYRWAYKQMQALRQEALDHRHDHEALSRVGLVIGEIESGMFDHLYESLSETERTRLDANLPENLRTSLGTMSARARQMQTQLWRRRLLEESLAFKPFFTP